MTVSKRCLHLTKVGLIVLLFSTHAPALWPQTREEVVLWESIKDSDRVADFQGYLDKYPNGTFAPIAARRIESLRGSAAATFHLNLINSGTGGDLRISPDGLEWTETNGKGKTNQKRSCVDTAFELRPNGGNGYLVLNGLMLVAAGNQYMSDVQISALKAAFARACSNGGNAGSSPPAINRPPQYAPPPSSVLTAPPVPSVSSQAPYAVSSTPIRLYVAHSHYLNWGYGTLTIGQTVTFEETGIPGGLCAAGFKCGFDAGHSWSAPVASVEAVTNYDTNTTYTFATLRVNGRKFNFTTTSAGNDAVIQPDDHGYLSTGKGAQFIVDTINSLKQR